MSPIRRVKARIGQLLLQKGLIVSEQLQEALSIQRRDAGKHVGQILLELGYVDRDELYAALAIQSGYPYVDIVNCTVKPDVISLIPEPMARQCQLFPIDRFEDILTVAMVNPLDRVTIEQLEKLTQKTIRVFLTTSVELKEMFTRYYEKKE